MMLVSVLVVRNVEMSVLIGPPSVDVQGVLCREPGELAEEGAGIAEGKGNNGAALPVAL